MSDNIQWGQPPLMPGYRFPTDEERAAEHKTTHTAAVNSPSVIHEIADSDELDDLIGMSAIGLTLDQARELADREIITFEQIVVQYSPATLDAGEFERALNDVGAL